MNIHENFQSQYHASLAMLRQIVNQCPDGLWDGSAHRNVFWRVAYHALFFTHLYLHASEDDFLAWARHREEYQDIQPGGEPYTKAEILEYCDLVGQQVDQKASRDSLEAPSGFPWLPFNRLEAHIYNIRHLHQHMGELSEQLGAAGIEVAWVITAK